jgi:hypothetical protein
MDTTVQDGIMQAILQQRQHDAMKERFEFDSDDEVAIEDKILTMTPFECMDLISEISVSEPSVIEDQSNTSVVVPLPFGQLQVRSSAGYWAEDFESELVIVSVEFSDLYHNNPLGLNSLNQQLEYTTAISRENKLVLQRSVSVAGGRTKESILREVAGVNQDAEKVHALLID